jgi:hypothetical protein
LGDGFGDALAVGGVERRGVLDDHGADHLAGDQQRGACAVGLLAAQLAAQQPAVCRVSLVRATESRRDARPRLDTVFERPREVRVLGDRSRRLEPVGAVVAVEDDHRRVGKRALEVAADEIVGLGLVVDDLHRGGKLGLGLTVATLALVARDRTALAAARDDAPDDAGDQRDAGAEQHEDPLEQALVGVLVGANRRAQPEHCIAQLLDEVVAPVGLMSIGRPGAEGAARQGEPALVKPVGASHRAQHGAVPVGVGAHARDDDAVFGLLGEELLQAVGRCLVG